MKTRIKIEFDRSVGFTKYTPQYEEIGGNPWVKISYWYNISGKYCLTMEQAKQAVDRFLIKQSVSYVEYPSDQS